MLVHQLTEPEVEQGIWLHSSLILFLSSPCRFFIERCLRELSQCVNGLAVSHHRVRRQQRAGWLVHERHELVRKTRHRAADTNPTNIRTTTHAVDPTTLTNVALDHRSPATELHDALARSVLLTKLCLFVIAAAIATFMHCLTEQPRGTQCFVERDHGRAAGRLIEKV